MTIQLNRHRLLPTIPEYLSDDNIILAQAGDEMNLTTKSALKVELVDTESSISKAIKSNYLNYIVKRFKSFHSSSITEATTDTISYFKKLSTLSRVNIQLDQLYGAASLLNLFNLSSDDLPPSYSHNQPVSVTNMGPINTTNNESSSTLCDSRRLDENCKPDKLSRHINVLYKSLGRLILMMSMISFIFVGLLMNIIQLVLYLTIFPINSKLFKRLSYSCAYMATSPVLTIAYYWTDIKLNIKFSKRGLIKGAYEPILGLLLLNHNYELDWLVCLVLGDQLGILRGYKSIIKSDIKYVPIVGWTLYMVQTIFIDRVWAKDRLIMSHQLNQLLDSKQIFLGLFCEGTRLTPEKLKASSIYAKNNNLKPLQHHLLPRARGFTHCVQHIAKMKGCHTENHDSHQGKSIGAYNDKEVPFRMFNIQIMLPSEPTFRSFMRGESFQADIYVEEVEPSKFKSITDPKEMDQLLYDVFQRKDDLVDQYRANDNKFPYGYEFPFKRRMAPLVYWMIGFLFTYSTLAILAIDLFLNVKFWLSISVLIFSSRILFRRFSRDVKSVKSSASGPEYLSKMESIGKESDHNVGSDTYCYKPDIDQ